MDGDDQAPQLPDRTAYFRDLLAHLARHDWPGAPRFCGLDSHGEIVLTPMLGHLASQPWQPPEIWSAASLSRVAWLVRQLHDLTAGTRFAGDSEVACHNDLAPRTTVYREAEGGFRPYGFVGWELAGPGRRVHDVAQLCWQFLGLHPDRTDAAGVGRLMRVVCDGYQLPMAGRDDLIPAIMWTQDRYLADFESGAGPTADPTGEPTDQPTGQQSSDAGETDRADRVRASRAWVADHAAALEAQL